MCVCVYSHYILNTYVRKHVCRFVQYIHIYIHGHTLNVYATKNITIMICVTHTPNCMYNVDSSFYDYHTKNTNWRSLRAFLGWNPANVSLCGGNSGATQKICSGFLVGGCQQENDFFFVWMYMFMDDEHLCLRVCWMYVCQYVYFYVCMHICMYVDRQKRMHICMYVDREKLSCKGVSKFRVWAVKWIFVPRFGNICTRWSKNEFRECTPHPNSGILETPFAERVSYDQYVCVFMYVCIHACVYIDISYIIYTIHIYICNWGQAGLVYMYTVYIHTHTHTHTYTHIPWEQGVYVERELGNDTNSALLYAKAWSTYCLYNAQVYVCIWVSAWVSEHVCVCVWERESEWERVCVCVQVLLAYMYISVCLCVRMRKNTHADARAHTHAQTYVYVYLYIHESTNVSVPLAILRSVGCLIHLCSKHLNKTPPPALDW